MNSAKMVSCSIIIGKRLTNYLMIHTKKHTYSLKHRSYFVFVEQVIQYLYRSQNPLFIVSLVFLFFTPILYGCLSPQHEASSWLRMEETASGY